MGHGGSVMPVPERPKTAAGWRQVIKRWEQSGLSMTAFAAQIGMSGSAVSYWKKRFERETSPGDSALNKAPPAFVPVTLVTEQKGATPVAGARLSAVFELLLRDGRALRIPPDFESASLARLLT